MASACRCRLGPSSPLLQASRGAARGLARRWNWVFFCVATFEAGSPPLAPLISRNERIVQSA